MAKLFVFCFLFLVITVHGQEEVPVARSEDGEILAKQPPEPIVPSTFITSVNEFGFNLINEINPSVEPPVPPKNVIFSPLGLANALAMLHQGAEGQTAEQFEAALGFEPAKIEKSKIPKLALDAMISMNSSNSPGSMVKMTNALLIQDGLILTSEYVQMIQEYFDAHIYFTGSPQACTDINKLVGEITEHHIDEALQSTPSEIMMVVMNFVYFKGNFMYPFRADKTYTDVFYGLNDTKYENVAYMSRYGPYGHVSLYDLEADMLELPFQGDNIALYAILPRDINDDLSDIRSNLNVSYIEQMINKLSYRHQATVIFPRMHYDLNYDNLADYLRHLTIINAFSNTDARFGGMSTKTPTLHVDQILHRTRLDLEEEPKPADGQASSASGSSSGASSPDIEPALAAMAKPLMYEFNHPFFYFIRHKQTGQIFVMGEMHQF